jgi:ribosomal protein L34E
MSNKTHWKKVVSDPNFLGEADFQEGEEKIATIARIAEKVDVKTARGKEKKTVVYFHENLKPMILNVARSKAISKVAGSPYFEDWINVTVQLYIDPHVEAFGEIVSAVRVRPRKPVIRQAVKCADCGNDIQGAFGKGAEYIAMHTKKNYGVSLCSECASKRAAQAAQQAQKPEESEGVTEDGQIEIDC